MRPRLRTARVSRTALWTIPLVVIAALTVAALAWAPSSGESGYLFAVIGNDAGHSRAEREAGVEAKVVRLSWRSYYPQEGEVDRGYVERKREEIRRLREAGFEVILELGFHDTPPWVHENYDHTYYVNQLDRRYTGTGPIDNGDANLVFNDELRGLVGGYMGEVFSELGTDFYAVRLGGGRYGELAYPPAYYGKESNLYWAYDEAAQRESPVPGWRPADDSPNGEAGEFLDWYLDSLVEYQGWQVDTLRRYYDGRIMMLYPSWGIRPGQAGEAVDQNLSGATPAEVNGEVQRGHAFARQVAALDDPGVVVTTTWLDADASGDGSDDPRRWSPVKYLHSLATDHRLDLGMYGENTGQGEPGDMLLSASQMRRYGLLGMAWYREEELFSSGEGYADLGDYERVIEHTREEA